MADANGHSNGKAQDNLTTHDLDIINRIFNPSLPGEEPETEEPVREEHQEIETPNARKVKDLEQRAVEEAEKRDYEKCFQLFDEALKILPNRASIYNNRAQALQLKGEIPRALEDLNKAIQLSDGKGKVAAQAFTQRGVIKRFQGDDEAALADFKTASHLGNQFARQQVIAMNPYAALCNQMMSEMVRKAKTGEI